MANGIAQAKETDGISGLIATVDIIPNQAATGQAVRFNCRRSLLTDGANTILNKTASVWYVGSHTKSRVIKSHVKRFVLATSSTHQRPGMSRALS